MTTLLDGKSVAREIRAELKETLRRDHDRGWRRPGLAVVWVGDNTSSEVYVHSKQRMAEQIGMHSEVHHLDADTSMTELLATLDRLNRDPDIDGILLQLPLPPGLDPDLALSGLDPHKDVDGLGLESQGRMMAGLPGFHPCTPEGIMRLLSAYQVPLEGRRVVVMGRSRLVGLPMALLLMAQHATVTVVHSRTVDPAVFTRSADVVVVAVGRPGLVTREWLKPGSVLVDVGITRLADGSIAGDADHRDIDGWVSHRTPVPGGVGPMTIAQLLTNTYRAFQSREGAISR